MGLFKMSTGGDNSTCCTEYVPVYTPATPVKETSPNPNRYRFEIIRLERTSPNVHLVWANYDGCLNYSGDKILLVKNWDPTSGELDPHFLENTKYLVIARFLPTKDGWQMGLNVAESLRT